MGCWGIDRRAVATTTVFLTAAALSACSGGASVTTSSDKSVKKAAVEKQVSDQLANKVGARPKSVTCPSDLKAKTGTTMRCTLIDSQGAKFGLTVKVTSVKGTTTLFDILIDDKPISGGSLAKALVETKVSDQLTAQVGQRPKSVVCPGDLKAVTGTTMRCTLTANDGTRFGLTVTVTSVEGTTVNFGIKVDGKPMP